MFYKLMPSFDKWSRGDLNTLICLTISNKDDFEIEKIKVSMEVE